MRITLKVFNPYSEFKPKPIFCYVIYIILKACNWWCILRCQYYKKKISMLPRKDRDGKAEIILDVV